MDVVALKGLIIPMPDEANPLTSEEIAFLKGWARAYLDGRWLLCLLYRFIAALGVVAGTAAGVWYLVAQFYQNKF